MQPHEFSLLINLAHVTYGVREDEVGFRSES